MNRLLATCPRGHTQMLTPREWHQIPKDFRVSAYCKDCESPFEANYGNCNLFIPNNTGVIHCDGLEPQA